MLPPPAKASAPAGAPREEPPKGPASPPRVESPAVVVRTPAPPVLRWTTVYGSAGDWMAIVTDGVKVWYVRAGDALPSGFRVVSVRVRPPGVALGRNGTAWQLPGPDGYSGGPTPVTDFVATIRPREASERETGHEGTRA